MTSVSSLNVLPFIFRLPTLGKFHRRRNSRRSKLQSGNRQLSLRHTCRLLSTVCSRASCLPESMIDKSLSEFCDLLKNYSNQTSLRSQLPILSTNVASRTCPSSISPTSRRSLATSRQPRPPMASARSFVVVQVITIVTVPVDKVPRSHARRVKGNHATVVADMTTLPQSASTRMPNATSAVRRVTSSKLVNGNLGKP